MNRTFALASLAAAAPLAVSAASILGLTGSAPAPVAATASFATPAFAAASPAAAALLAPPTAVVSTAAAMSTIFRLSPRAFLAAAQAVPLSPDQQLHHDAQARARNYLELCATDTSFGGGPGTSPRVLSDVVAVLECGNRVDATQPFGAIPWDRVTARIQDGIAALNARDDGHPPDMDCCDLLRIIYLHPAVPYVPAHPTVGGSSGTTTRLAPSRVSRWLRSSVVSSAILSAISAPAPAPTGFTPGGQAQNPQVRLSRDLDGQIRTAFKNFKWWVDEPGNDNICFWSENHQIMFASSEYLAGQLMPNEWFPNGGMTGADHKAKARHRVLRWLDERLKFGFSEWNSPGYYEEDLRALFNLADFADEEMIRRRATMVLDLMIFDLARFTQFGSFGVTAGRCYEKLGGDGSQWKHSGWQQSVGSLIEILFGTRGHFTGSGDVGALSYATSSYQVPTVLLSIGQDRPDHFVDRSRVSLDFDEAGDQGIGFTGLDDAMFWWGKSAYVTKQNIANTRQMMLQYGISNMRSNINDTLGPVASIFWSANDGELYAAADAASPITEGMNLTKANLYTYRNRDAMLSSVQDYHRGQIGPQQQVWQATLGMDSVVYTTLPGKRESDGPGYWTGSAALPSAIQYENACIVAYDAPLIVQLKEGLHRTHAFFPQDKFDEFDRRRGSNLNGAWGVTDNGTWIFGRKGDGYVGLYSNEGYDNGPTDWVAAGSWTNVFICQVGNAAEFGDFESFKNQVSSARIYVHYPHFGDWSPVYCSYDIPGKGRLELNYGSNPHFNGQEFDVHNFPRYDNNYAQCPWGLGALGIRNAGYELIHLRDTTDPQNNPQYDVRIVDKQVSNP